MIFDLTFTNLSLLSSQSHFIKHSINIGLAIVIIVCWIWITWSFLFSESLFWFWGISNWLRILLLFFNRFLFKFYFFFLLIFFWFSWSSRWCFYWNNRISCTCLQLSKTWLILHKFFEIIWYFIKFILIVWAHFQKLIDLFDFWNFFHNIIYFLVELQCLSSVIFWKLCFFFLNIFMHRYKCFKTLLSLCFTHLNIELTFTGITFCRFQNFVKISKHLSISGIKLLKTYNNFLWSLFKCCLIVEIDSIITKLKLFMNDDCLSSIVT